MWDCQAQLCTAMYIYTVAHICIRSSKSYSQKSGKGGSGNMVCRVTFYPLQLVTASFDLTGACT